MTTQSENKTDTTAIDKPAQPVAPSKPVKGELSEQELEKTTGGTTPVTEPLGDGSVRF